jgi:hypothetical protein
MTPRKQDLAARRRGELHREPGTRHLVPALNARRKLNARQADSIRIRPDPAKLSDRRFAYLKHAHD